MPTGVIILFVLSAVFYLIIKFASSPRSSSSNDYDSDPIINKSINRTNEINRATETKKATETKSIQPKKIEYTKKEIIDIFVSDQNTKSFFNEILHKNTKVLLQQRQTRCWRCHRPLSSDKNKVCIECGWLVCECGTCSPRCSRSEIKNFRPKFTYYILNRRKLFDYVSKNIDTIYEELSVSYGMTEKSLVEHISKNEAKIFGRTQDGYDSEGYDRLGYDSQGYNRKGFNRYGYDRFGYDKDGYDRYGCDISGYNCRGYDKDGYDKDGYDEKGFDVNGYDKNGFNKEGYDKDNYDKDGYDLNGFERNGIHKNGTLYDDDGFNKEGYDCEEYDRSGYNSLGYNRKGYDRNGYDINGFNIDGFDISGYDKDGYDKKGFSIDGYNRNGFDKEGYDKEKYNEYGYNDEGFTKEGTRNEWIGVKVEHISCGKGRVFGFYNNEGKKYIVVRYDSNYHKDGKFLFSEKVLSILKFIDYTPNFNE